jgi:signal transduction histidine kinase
MTIVRALGGSSCLRLIHPIESRIRRRAIHTDTSAIYTSVMKFTNPNATAGSPVNLFLRKVLGSAAGRRSVVVLVLCFVVSTEILFIPATWDDWSARQIFAGWLEQFLDDLCLAISMMLAVSLVDSLVEDESWQRIPALVAAVVLAGVLAYSGLTVYHFPAGYYPPLPLLAGEAMRPALLGTLVTLVWAIQRRNARAARRLQRLEIDRVALNRRMLEAQLQVMEAQIEPHFLFNTLATVKRLYRTQSASGERMLDSLQLYLRSALPRIRGDKSTLGNEFDLVGAYLDMLQIRMGDRLLFSITLPRELAALEFPPMMLITLVENAIKHGLTPLAEGGRIDFQARVDKGTLEVRVADTGAGFQASSGSGIGLANIRSRLTALYGGRARLQLESNTPRGVVSLISVPCSVPYSTPNGLEHVN